MWVFWFSDKRSLRGRDWRRKSFCADGFWAHCLIEDADFGELMRSLSKEQAERLRKQRERQRVYRLRLKAERRPSRDDIARVVLLFMIVRASKDWNHRFLEQLTDLILKGLKSQGFDEDASLDVLDDLIAKYATSTCGFRRKIHTLRREVLIESGN